MLNKEVNRRQRLSHLTWEKRKNVWENEVNHLSSSIVNPEIELLKPWKPQKPKGFSEQTLKQMKLNYAS